MDLASWLQGLVVTWKSGDIKRPVRGLEASRRTRCDSFRQSVSINQCLRLHYGRLLAPDSNRINSDSHSLSFRQTLHFYWQEAVYYIVDAVGDGSQQAAWLHFCHLPQRNESLDDPSVPSPSIAYASNAFRLAARSKVYATS